jgi:hypothetical protein
VSAKTKSVGFFILCFAFGLSVFFSISENVKIQRDPAAISGKVFQITNLSSEQIKQHLTQKIKVFPTVNGKKSIQFLGFSSNLCKTYPEIELEFQAEGVAVAGEVPTMKVTSPCGAGQDPAEMASIQLPIEKLLGEKPRNATFSFDGFVAKMEFKHAADDWPRQWVLKSVHFKNATGEFKSAHFNRKLASEQAYERQVVLEF